MRPNYQFMNKNVKELVEKLHENRSRKNNVSRDCVLG